MGQPVRVKIFIQSSLIERDKLTNHHTTSKYVKHSCVDCEFYMSKLKVKMKQNEFGALLVLEQAPKKISVLYSIDGMVLKWKRQIKCVRYGINFVKAPLIASDSVQFQISQIVQVFSLLRRST